MDRDGVNSPSRLIELAIINTMPNLGGVQIYTKEIRERLAVSEQESTEAMKKIFANFVRKKGLDAEVATLEVNDEPSE